ncbi:gamma-glutamylcyclotransferase [Maritimibacter sp. HL-12]|jgi:glutathione-specific gamma-glutamylcyclotransferase|uniref:gamma-glutamylcyclotransferase n=1 Tax=Maritimibacter sp. HL-12 TaxID=1162418 RepID=UPI000A0F0337|nr:gamma-glutamylcyclotransferase [Maritimibacter sp. HL-12]SMH37261.1 cation transport protein ChaC [Maritimibacter sp. HL-12]
MARKDLWVFGYGSLIWHPGFDHVETVLATLPDHARSFCMRSIHHRGTTAHPGLVLALDPHPGVACTGMAFRVDPGAHEETMAVLRERELISSAYIEQVHQLALADGRQVDAVTYVIDRDHVQYCGGLPLDEQAAIIARAVGDRGPNRDYLFNTADHLAALGIEDAELSWLARVVRAMDT